MLFASSAFALDKITLFNLPDTEAFIFQVVDLTDEPDENGAYRIIKELGKDVIPIGREKFEMDVSTFKSMYGVWGFNIFCEHGKLVVRMAATDQTKELEVDFSTGEARQYDKDGILIK